MGPTLHEWVPKMFDGTLPPISAWEHDNGEFRLKNERGSTVCLDKDAMLRLYAPKPELVPSVEEQKLIKAKLKDLDAQFYDCFSTPYAITKAQLKATGDQMIPDFWMEAYDEEGYFWVIAHQRKRPVAVAITRGYDAHRVVFFRADQKYLDSLPKADWRVDEGR